MGGAIDLGARTLPRIPRHSGDRNRTSPFAFTGNKFEFRALGGSQSVAFANTVLNTIVAESIDTMADRLEAALAGGTPLDDAVLEVVREFYSANKRIVFDGDGYSEEWHAEAAERGLSNLPPTPDALPAIIDEQTIAAFSRYGVLSERELESRYEVLVEQYIITLNIEAETAASIARTMILPAAIRHVGELKLAGVETLVTETSGLIDELVEAIFALEVANRDHPEIQGTMTHAKYERDIVIPAMLAVRDVADRLERIVADDLWPLPKYAEMLFIK
jgi:glutamine synthetase